MELPISFEQFEALLSQAYSGATEDPPWQGFLDSLRTVMKVRAAAITLFNPDNERNSKFIISAAPGDDTDWSAIEDALYSRGIEHESVLHAVQPGQVAVLDTRALDADYRKFLESFEIAHSLRAGLTGCGGARGWLELIRSDPAANFVDEEMELCRRLLRHLDTALDIHLSLMEKETERSIQDEAIGQLSLGIILLDGNAEVLLANEPATAIIEHSHGNTCSIALKNKRLTLSDSSKQKELSDALRRAIQQCENPDNQWPGEVLRLNASRSDIIGMLIKHVPQATRLQGSHTPLAPHAVIYMSDTGHAPRALRRNDIGSPELISRLLQLTPREAKLALLLADSVSLQEAAEAMQISEGTARNYSKRIYQKFGVHRQSDLIRIVHRCLALLR